MWISVDTTFLISIHALVKRATNDSDVKLLREDISIHALVKRATLQAVIHPQHLNFNPRPREEGDV